MKDKKNSLTNTINIMFPAMKYGLENGLKQCTKFFIYDLANPIFYDFSPRFFVSENVKKSSKFQEILKMSEYSKAKVYKTLNIGLMKVHEEHMTPNGQLQKKLLEFDESKNFELFIRNNYAIAIITKEENQRLDKGGFRSKRTNLEDALIAYRHVGINIYEFKFKSNYE